MLSRAENELLTRVEGEAPMGQMLRRYWVPALPSEDLVADGAPHRVRLFGERLVAFRDSNGRVGVMDENCPHRGASLALAVNADCGLRCLYHGWKMDVAGRILDTPSEPEDSTFKDRIRHTAYETREAGGVIWVYLGSANATPGFPAFEWTALPAENVLVMYVRQHCNWVQALEGVIDSAHINFLHADFAARTLRNMSGDGRPQLEIQNTAYGFRYAAIRRPLDDDPERFRHVRVSLFVAPCYGFTPMRDGVGFMQAFVPLDDVTTGFYFVVFSLDGPLDAARRDGFQRQFGLEPGVDLGPDHEKVRSAANNWLQDREAMQRGDTFAGFGGKTTMEDMAVQESMGPIYDRTREHVGTSDMAVIRMRRLMLDSVRRFQDGGVPLGLDGRVPYEKLRSVQAVIPLEQSWRTVATGAGEPIDDDEVPAAVSADESAS